MSELHLRQPIITYKACGLFTKYHKRIQKFKKSSYIYKNGLDKACFAHDAAYSDSKYLAKKTVSDKVLKDEAYEIAMNPKYDGYQGGLSSMVYKFFDKKIGSRMTSKKISNLNEVLAQELHKPVIKKFKRGRVYVRFKDIIWAANSAEMRLLSFKS